MLQKKLLTFAKKHKSLTLNFLDTINQIEMNSNKRTEADKLYDNMKMLPRCLDENGDKYILKSIFLVIEVTGEPLKNEGFFWKGSILDTIKTPLFENVHTFRIGGEDGSNIETVYDYEVMIKRVFTKFAGTIKIASYLTEEQYPEGGFGYYYCDIKGSKKQLYNEMFYKEYLNSIQYYHKSKDNTSCFDEGPLEGY